MNDREAKTDYRTRIDYAVFDKSVSRGEHDGRVEEGGVLSSKRSDNNQHTHPLSDAGIAALRRITAIMQDCPELRDCCSSKEISGQVHDSYEGCVKRSLQPDADEFIKECRDTLLSSVKEHIYLVTLEGLELSDLDRLELGPVSICKPDMALLNEVQSGGAITEDWIQKEFSKGLWLIGRSRGSPEISSKHFEHQTILTIGILAVCGAMLYEGSIWQSHLRAALSPHRQYDADIHFSLGGRRENSNSVPDMGQRQDAPAEH